MILSRVFTVAASIFIVASIAAYLLIDHRETHERALDYIDKGNFFRVIEIYESERSLEEEDYALLSLAVSGIEKKINQNQNESQKKEWISDLNDYHEITHTEYQVNGTTCTHLEDPFFKYLKKHAYWYQKTLLERVHSTIFCNPPDKNSEYLNRILLEDPRNFMKDTSIAIVELFRSPMDPIGEIEINFLHETIHFLATQETTAFFDNLYKLQADRVNFRSGPGVEYPSKLQLLHAEELYCFDKDSREETIAGKTGVWLECFSTKHFLSGWIFSPQLQNISPNQELVDRCKSRFSSLEYFAQIDFDTWRPESMPLYFYGDYKQTSRNLRHGEVGFTLYRPTDGKVSKICRKFSGKKNFIEVYFDSLDSEQPTPIADFHISALGTSKAAFSLRASATELELNGKKFMIDDMSSRETVALKISVNKQSNLLGTLIRKNSGILSNIESYPVDSSAIEKGNYSWEICIPQAENRSGDTAYLYGFRIGKE
ncbi:MAG: hypothetical protein GW938_15055 [Leptospira sp.]|nr:hypothetical protein [Leptospira sp.]